MGSIPSEARGDITTFAKLTLVEVGTPVLMRESPRHDWIYAKLVSASDQRIAFNKVVSGRGMHSQLTIFPHAEGFRVRPLSAHDVKGMIFSYE
jgi:hypothetical protein